MTDEKEDCFSSDYSMESEINYEIQGFGILLFQVLRAPNSHGRRGVGSGRGGGAGKGILPVSLRQGSGLCAGNMQQCWDVFYKCSLEIFFLKKFLISCLPGYL